MKLHFLLALVCSLSLTVSGCSTTTQAYFNTINIAFKGRSVELSEAEVAASKADVMQIKAGERDLAVLALAFIDGEKYRWISGDNIVFTMQHGVIVQTEGLDSDLHYTGNLQNNPLGSDDTLAFQWGRKVDVENVGYGLGVKSTWRITGEETREYMGYAIPMLAVKEQVTFPSTTPYIEIGLSWENTYYLHASTKQLLATSQKFNPKGDVYDMVYLSRIVRLMNKPEGAQ
ncbi:YjbF family lipoprotein [Alteromonas sp. A079]|uniref:YjbF family lipoprotein n=1 Tax=Alteromonas sp. A079 TaxID=3410268 RepID=UPI003BA3BAF6